MDDLQVTALELLDFGVFHISDHINKPPTLLASATPDGWRQTY